MYVCVIRDYGMSKDEDKDKVRREKEGVIFLFFGEGGGCVLMRYILEGCMELIWGWDGV